MDFITDPKEIERRSMELIEPCLRCLHLPSPAHQVYSRMIHAAGDEDYAALIMIHKQAIAAGRNALQKGAHIYTDVEMVRTGINKKKLSEYGGEVHCIIAEPQTAERAQTDKITRSMAAMRIFGAKLNGSIVAIGNAPTALFELLRLVEEEGVTPALIIGIPVGFVGAADSKEMLTKNGKIPYISVAGPKGGSPIAAAAVNALLYMKE